MSKSQLYVLSTLTADVKYGPHIKGPNDVPIRNEHVLIKGGAGITTDRLYTPRGVATPITPAQLALLEQDPVFLLHRENGYIEVNEGEADPEIFAQAMSVDVGSAPKTEEDFKEPPKEDETPIKAVVPTPNKK